MTRNKSDSDWKEFRTRGRRKSDAEVCAFHDLKFEELSDAKIVASKEIKELKKLFYDEIKELKLSLGKMLPRWVFTTFAASVVGLAAIFYAWNSATLDKADLRASEFEDVLEKRMVSFIKKATENGYQLAIIQTKQDAVMDNQKNLTDIIRNIEIHLGKSIEHYHDRSGSAVNVPGYEDDYPR